MFDDVIFECDGCGAILLEEELELGSSDLDSEAPSCPSCGAFSFHLVGD
jgi:predicted  nucleic acid-binding Zn-ribbon protein